MPEQIFRAILFFMLDFILNNLPWLWLGVLVICIIIEAFTLSLTTIWSAIAAIPMIFISKTGMPFKWQLLIFALITLGLIIFTRPFAIKKLKIGRSKTNVNSLIGQEILVTKTVSQFQKGEAKTNNGVIWSVKSENDEEIAKGTVCIISEVEGNTLIIKQKI